MTPTVAPPATARVDAARAEHRRDHKAFMRHARRCMVFGCPNRCVIGRAMEREADASGERLTLAEQEAGRG